jgi:hypothetical protein
MVTSARLNISGANTNPNSANNASSSNFAQQLKKQGYFPGQIVNTQSGFLGSKQTTYTNPNNGARVVIKESALSGYQVNIGYLRADGKPVSVTVAGGFKGNLTVTCTGFNNETKELALGPNVKLEFFRGNDGTVRLFIDGVEASEAVARRGARVTNFTPATTSDCLK